MGSSLSSRGMLAICCTLVILLAALAVVQYGWSTRVAAADAQRERDHLTSAASLFSNEFNTVIAQTITFLQEDAWAAVQSGKRLTAVPKLISELYYLDVPALSSPKAQRLMPEGLFRSVPLPEWNTMPRCAALVMQEPLALVVPIFEVDTTEIREATGVRILQRLSRRPERCFVARMDKTYLRDSLLPELIRNSFGETIVKEYSFAVATLSDPSHVVYGTPGRADVKKAFFSMAPRPPFGKPSSGAPEAPGRNTVYFQRTETIVTLRSGGLVGLSGPGIWELGISHRGMPLAAVHEQKRRRDLMLSVGVELLLITAILFLVVGTRRMQRIAHQKMQFVAGVSHELRTPVSAIAMLSRNQADGLVTGADKVKQYGELIHQQSRRLNEMVEQTLQYAGIHSGLRRTSRNQVDVGRLIHEAVEERREELSRRGFQVEVEVNPDVLVMAGDAKLLRTAFDNLLSNAEKYADGGCWIRVSALYSAPDKEVRISVEDRGPGIDPADQAQIFEPFCRGRAAIEAQIPGSGLGLSLVRSAAEAHHGSVTLASEPGHGSTFTLHLPV